MKTVKFYTLGCKVNQYDTQEIREQFLRAGFKELTNGLPADIYLINTCTVTHRADAESSGLIRRARRENRCAKIIVTGCLAELDGGRIKEQGADLVVKNKDKQILLQKLQSLRGVPTIFVGTIASPVIARSDFCDEAIPPLTGSQQAAQSPGTRRLLHPSLRSGFAMTGISNFSGHSRAFLKIQDGCDNFCSYCKVPLVRGRSRSRPLPEIVAEARRLVKNGFKEIVLTGICLGAYNFVGTAQCAVPTGTTIFSLIDVISTLEQIDGLLRIRLSSIEAADISDVLIDKIASSSKLCPHLHIPVQSGSNRVLKAMRRKDSRGKYLRLIKKIKSRVPGIAITTDVLVGFPGESGADFENTVSLIKEIIPLKAHIFPYSKREGTAAAGLDQRIGPDEIKRRISGLKEIADRCSFDYRRQFLRKIADVLIEGRSEEKPDFWEGYAANYMKVLAASRRNLKNKVIPLKIKMIAEGYALGTEFVGTA